jgi:hypothetical protein
MSEGETQGESPELPTGLYDGILGKTETEETPATEQEDGGADAETQETAAEAADTSKPESTTENWEERYTNLQRKFGEQGNELGELRKAVAELKANQTKQQPVDPFADDPTLKALDPTQKNLVLRGTDVAMKRLLNDMGMDPTDLPKIKQMVTELSENTTRDAILREVGEIRKEVGEAAFAKNLPKLQAIANKHPSLSPHEAWKLATADDNREAQSKKVKALEAERKQRAASADFGKERPNKQTDGKLSQAELRKLSAKPQGRPSPRFAALLAETRREMGG